MKTINRILTIYILGLDSLPEMVGLEYDHHSYERIFHALPLKLQDSDYLEDTIEFCIEHTRDALRAIKKGKPISQTLLSNFLTPEQLNYWKSLVNSMSQSTASSADTVKLFIGDVSRADSLPTVLGSATPTIDDPNTYMICVSPLSQYSIAAPLRDNYSATLNGRNVPISVSSVKLNWDTNLFVVFFKIVSIFSVSYVDTDGIKSTVDITANDFHSALDTFYSDYPNSVLSSVSIADAI